MKLKDLLRELLFNNEFNQMNIRLIQLRTQIHLFERSQHDTEQMLTCIMEDYHNQIIYYATNKFDEKIYVVKRSSHYNSDTFDLYLYCINYSSSLNMLPVVHCSYYNHHSLSGNNSYIRIDDILMKEHINKGNGTIAIKGLIKVAQHINAKRICGFLSDVDIEKFDMLEHFYKKCGFKVTFNENRTSGHIELLI